jgi:hypothetical protein
MYINCTAYHAVENLIVCQKKDGQENSGILTFITHGSAGCALQWHTSKLLNPRVKFKPVAQ